VKGERLVQTAAALGVLVVWAVLQIIDARSETYGVPQEVTVIAFVAAGFLFSTDIGSLIRAWRGRSNGEPKEQPVDEP
jgi:uncharacterized membrane protein YdbT with pleckstrin-like domain